jgi:predicted nicotinamide N-methyase
LAEYLVLHPQLTSGKKIVELGAGLGLPSFVAAQTAAAVLCTDHAPEAVQLAERSAKHLGLQNFRSAVLDWHHLPLDLEADVLLLSDINYEPDAFTALMKLIDDFLQKGTTIILSTPQRLMAKEFIHPLLAAAVVHEEMNMEINGEHIAIALLILKRK